MYLWEKYKLYVVDMKVHIKHIYSKIWSMNEKNEIPRGDFSVLKICIIYL